LRVVLGNAERAERRNLQAREAMPRTEAAAQDTEPSGSRGHLSSSEASGELGKALDSIFNRGGAKKESTKSGSDTMTEKDVATGKASLDKLLRDHLPREAASRDLSPIPQASSLNEESSLSASTISFREGEVPSQDRERPKRAPSAQKRLEELLQRNAQMRASASMSRDVLPLPQTSAAAAQPRSTKSLADLLEADKARAAKAAEAAEAARKAAETSEAAKVYVEPSKAFKSLVGQAKPPSQAQLARRSLSALLPVESVFQDLSETQKSRAAKKARL
jgi:hypothetical protein